VWPPAEDVLNRVAGVFTVTGGSEQTVPEAPDDQRFD
jgi:hypothetical protein